MAGRHRRSVGKSRPYHARIPNMQIGSLPPDYTTSLRAQVTQQAEAQGQTPSKGPTQAQQTQQPQHTDKTADHDHNHDQGSAGGSTGQQVNVVA
jgi:hypothetical protein